MTPKEREALTRFMRLVLSQMHPNWMEYGLPRLREQDSGDGLELSVAGHLQYAYYMFTAIEEISGLKEF